MEKKTLIKALRDVIEDGINGDFWDEDSILVDAFYEATGDQLDCEGLSVYPDINENLVVELGNYRFEIAIK